MHVIGTAGHVDHGKSSLVQALTGTNPDRWAEEQQRGMTLDLGFAHVRFDDGTEAGIVDVPGHERFLHNMLAGAAGMELMLLVIAANEGVMPQTLEHLQIAELLRVRSIVVALTKIDLVDPARAGYACRDMHRALQGTAAARSPVYAVSTVTGENLDVLRLGLAFELAQLPRRDASAPVYLPVDRVFTLSGHGTIVTGTLMQGRVTVGDTLRLQPQDRDVRVKSLQVFGEARAEATAGARVALNLAGVDRDDLARGDVLADPQIQARSTYAVVFDVLPEAQAAVRRRTHVRAHIGAAEVLGTLVEGFLHLRRPVAAYPGVRFILRRLTPKALLGGGEIVGTASAEATSPVDSLEEHLRTLLAQSDVPLEVSALAYAANAREALVADALEALVERGDAIAVERPRAYLSQARADAIGAAVERELQRLRAEEPWALGATSLGLARATSVHEPMLVRVLATFSRDGRLASRAGYFSVPSHQPQLSAAQREFFERVLPFDPTPALTPVDFPEIAAAVKSAAVPGLSKAFDTLLARGTLIKVGDSLYRGTQIQEMHARIERFVAANGRMTVAQFRDAIELSRKYAVPLLEWFDGRGITVRDGDFRTVRTRRGADLPVV